MPPTKPDDRAPERFIPGEMRGQLVEAEHLARYRLAQPLARGCRVLDAGCGMAYGTQMLADAGATTTVGVDISEAALGAAAEHVGAGITLEPADLAALPHEDGSFDLVVCFEAIEHVDDPEVVLDQLARVVSGTGLLVVSSPNRGQYPPGNPHHQHEFTPDELKESLERRFAHVRLLRQQAWTASMIQSDEGFAADGLDPVDLDLFKVAARRPGKETFTIALASNVKLPPVRDVGVITAAEEVNRWLQLFDEQHAVLTEQARVMGWHAEEDAERLALHARLREVEAQIERIPELEREAYDERRDRLDAASHFKEDLEFQTARADQAERVQRDLKSSLSWRLTKPLRALKR